MQPRIDFRLLALTAVAAVLAGLRFFQTTQPPNAPAAYQAAAHLFVGGVFGAWLADRRKEYLWLWVGLTAVELSAFLILR